MFLLVAGIVILLLALLALLWNLRMSYVTHGGSIGQDPVVASTAIQVPLLVVVGLKLVDSSARIEVVRAWLAPWWSYLLVWGALVITLGWLAIKVGQFGASRQSQSGRFSP